MARAVAGHGGHAARRTAAAPRPAGPRAGPGRPVRCAVAAPARLVATRPYLPGDAPVPPDAAARHSAPSYDDWLCASTFMFTAMLRMGPTPPPLSCGGPRQPGSMLSR